MRKNKIQPGIIVYTCLIQTCIKSGDIHTALKKFEEMTAEGISADHVTYSTLIKGCLQFKKLTEACDLLEDSFKNQINVGSEVTE